MLFAVHFVFEMFDLVVKLGVPIGDLFDLVWAAAEKVAIQGEVVLRDQAADLADIGGVVARVLVLPTRTKIHQKQEGHHDEEGPESEVKFLSDAHDISSEPAARGWPQLSSCCT